MRVDELARMLSEPVEGQKSISHIEDDGRGRTNLFVVEHLEMSFPAKNGTPRAPFLLLLRQIVQRS